MPTLFMTQTKLVFKSKYKYQKTENHPPKKVRGNLIGSYKQPAFEPVFLRMISEEMIGLKRKRPRERIFLERFNELERENVITKLDIKHFRNFVGGNHSNCVSTIHEISIFMSDTPRDSLILLYPSHGRPFHKTFVCP